MRWGWTYRKDWFAKPELRQEFKTKYGHELAPPKTWDEFMQVAESFSQTPSHRWQEGLWCLHLHGARIEGITMGVTNVMLTTASITTTRRSPYEITDL